METVAEGVTAPQLGWGRCWFAGDPRLSQEYHCVSEENVCTCLGRSWAVGVSNRSKYQGGDHKATSEDSLAAQISEKRWKDRKVLVSQ